MIVVRAGESPFLMCRMKAAKALASAVRLASLNVESTSTVLPPASWARGKRSWFATTQVGAKLVSPFFQLPNHSHAMRMLLALASWMTSSAKVKSNLPSSGSIHAQAIGASTVLSPMVTRFGHTAFMCSGLEAAVLVSSPARARNGFPSTMSWVAAPLFPGGQWEGRWRSSSWLGRTLSSRPARRSAPGRQNCDIAYFPPFGWYSLMHCTIIRSFGDRLRNPETRRVSI